MRSTMQWHRTILHRGFTLVELLVVVAIIVVLLALLSPAMDRAIYAAQLVTCAAQQDGIAAGAMLYAMNNKRMYPYRAGTDEGTSGNYWPIHINLPFNAVHNKGNINGYDDRPLIRGYINIQAMLDPMAPGKVDLAGAPSDSWVFTSYSLWFGWKYIELPQNHSSTPCRRMGQPWSYYKPDPFNSAKIVGGNYTVLLGDTHGFYGIPFEFSHPDRDEVAEGRVRREEAWNSGPAQGQDKNTLSLWEIAGKPVPSGPQMDENYAFEDGSVRAYKDVWLDVVWWNAWGGKETRFDTVPSYHRQGPPWLAIPKDK
jgi:prepilin-type N-terminal cleavage/methylation domain-containing protein